MNRRLLVIAAASLTLFASGPVRAADTPTFVFTAIPDQDPTRARSPEKPFELREPGVRLGLGD